jgi:hypothetical protein
VLVLWRKNLKEAEGRIHSRICCRIWLFYYMMVEVINAEDVGIGLICVVV